MRHFIMVNEAGVYVKDGDFFVQQGGLKEPWGKNWKEIDADGLNHARMIGEAMRARSEYTKVPEPEPQPHRCELVQFLENVGEEVQNARDKFPGRELTMTALTEEVGELARALMDESRQRVYNEAVQVAAMAARVVLDGDSGADARRQRKQLDSVP